MKGCYTAGYSGTLYSRIFGTKPQAKCPDHLHDGSEFRIAFLGKRLVQTLTRQPGITGKLAHSLRPGNAAKRGTNDTAITRIFLNAGIKEKSDVLVCLEMFDNIPFFQFQFTHFPFQNHVSGALYSQYCEHTATVNHSSQFVNSGQKGQA